MGTAGTGIIERWRAPVERVWPAAVAVRVIVALILIVGPATDEPADLEGWDAERFQQIAERDRAAWSEHPVEYPPGSVVVFDRLAGGDVVDTHRRLVAMSLVLDLGLALVIRRRIGPGSARTYLVIGLPLVPFGYQRLDLLVTTIAVIGALALLTGARARSPGPANPSRRGDRPIGGSPAAVPADVVADVAAAVAIAAGAMIKVWPLVLVVGALAIGRVRAGAGAVALTAIAGSVWLAMTGDGLAPVDQVLSLRGATGWHVESLPGSVVALLGSARAELELNAYRIGTLRPGLVGAGRMVAVVVMGLLAVAGRSRSRSRTQQAGTASDDRVVFSLTVLGSLAVLLVTSPLLSPQFLVWLTPWAALTVVRPDDADRGPAADEPGPRDGPALALTCLATMATGIALHVFGPASLAATAPAALLTGRNLVLVALPLICLAALAGRAGPLTPSGMWSRTPAGAPVRRPTPGRSGSADR